MDTLFGLLAPWSCLVCGQEGSFVCLECFAAVPAAPERCYRCLSSVSDGALCADCGPSTSLSAVWSSCEYLGLSSELLHRLKFERAGGSAVTLAEIMVPRIPCPLDGYLVPIPTATRRVRARGYDQAVLLARALSQKWSLPYLSVLARQGQQRQLGASRVQRQSQLASAYRVKRTSAVAGKQIILVDDVLTTGATVEAVAKLCMQHGATSVSAITFAQKL